MRDALPSASFIGFTGTPIELADANTRAVFGDHISIYDIQRAVEDGATVPIYYESRLAKLALDECERPTIDAGFEEVTEGEEVDRREKLKTKWAQLEAIVGAEKRVARVARDIVEHFESRQEAMDGKAMVVCMSRRICIDLYRELVRLRPAWHDDDNSGALKVVMTGKAADPPDWQLHIRNKPRREALAKRFRDPADPLRIVLVRDMWLTGFDAPSLHTMYVDKPMRGHGLTRGKLLLQSLSSVRRLCSFMTATVMSRRGRMGTFFSERFQQLKVTRYRRELRIYSVERHWTARWRTRRRSWTLSRNTKLLCEGCERPFRKGGE